MTFAYATTNRLTGLTASAFSVTTGAGPSGATELYLNDGRMDRQYTFTAGTTAETLQIDLGSALAVVGVAILNHNLVALGSASVTITAADDSGFTTGVVTPKAATTLNTTEPKHKDHVLQFASVSKRYWRIAMSHAAATALKIGEVFLLAASTQLTRGMLDGSGESEEIISVGNRMMYGATKSTFFAGPIRSKQMKYQDFTEAQLLELRTLWAAVKGPVTPFLWIESYEAVSTAAASAQQDCIFGQIQDARFAWTFVDSLYRQPPGFDIVSLGREVGS